MARECKHLSTTEGKRERRCVQMKKPKTEFGREVARFRISSGMTEREFSENAGVNYWTLRDVCSGRTTGTNCNLIPKARRYMKTYIEQKEATI